MSTRFRAYVLDDEPLASRRLVRLLRQSELVEVIGESNDPVSALEEIEESGPDVLFLDIEMPGLNGFELLSKMRSEPLVIFTTAYNQYALQAFQVNSVGYLLKPVEAPQLAKVLQKLDRIRRGSDPRPDLDALVRQLRGAIPAAAPEYPERIASKLGEKVEFVELAKVTHIFAKDKLTFAATATKAYCLDATIAEMEARLDPKRFVRIHRSTIVNSEYVHELYPWFAGRMLVRLKDEKKTELTVARERVKDLKEHLGI